MPRFAKHGLSIVPLVLLGSGPSSIPGPPGSRPRVLDAFDGLEAWTAHASDGVKARLQTDAGVEGSAMRLDFDLRGVAGWAFARRALPLRLPGDFELSFLVRGNAPRNNLEFKLVDPRDENVWWFVVRDFDFPRDWERITIPRRRIEFAWGPTEDRRLTETAFIELVVSAGSGGGRGSVWVDELTIRALPAASNQEAAPTARASSSSPNTSAAHALDGRLDTAWRSDPSTGPRQTVTVDLGSMRAFGGLRLHWAPASRASHYRVERSDDGTNWQVAYRAHRPHGLTDDVRLPESSARFVRLRLDGGPSTAYALREFELQDLAFGDPNHFVAAIAGRATRGHYPRAFSREQSYWTLVAVDGGKESALLSEDGALELERGGCSIEPFIVRGSELTTWADVDIHHALVDGYLPIPSVTWQRPDWSLRTTAYARSSGAAASRDGPTWLTARYAVRNKTAEPLHLELVLAVRPYQVNPPTQSLNLTGGVSPIETLRWNDTALEVNGRRRLRPRELPDRVGLSPFDGRGIPGALSAARDRRPSAIHDTDGLAEGVLVYELELAPRAERVIDVFSPLGDPPVSTERPLLPERTAEHVASAWRRKLNRVAFRVPPEGRRVIDTLRTSLAYILMSRDGPALRPGTRSYARSWVRDGAMMATALLRLGHADVAEDYLRWYAPHQFENGKVPCCIDGRGADPVPEHDSHGQLVFLAAEIYRFARKRALLESVWDHVEEAVGYLESLRRSERTPQNRTPERRHLYGLLPPSISHEGYAAKPAYSYWDDFWALRGWKDAVFIAKELGKTHAVERFERQRDAFRRDLHASLRASAAVHQIDYIPGAADRGDFDATSTTVALFPGGEHAGLPKELLRATYERYWQAFTERRRGVTTWATYTPYELRVVGTFVRLGERARANALLDYFLADRRPAAWNQWAEVVGRDPRTPAFIGDMPHSWIASDYIQAALDMFVYRREVDQALVVAAGVPADWFEAPEGLAVERLRTTYGEVSYSIASEQDRIRIELTTETRPPGGFVFPWPWAGTPGIARTDSKVLRWRDGEVVLPTPPTAVYVQRPIEKKVGNER